MVYVNASQKLRLNGYIDGVCARVFSVGVRRSSTSSPLYVPYVIWQEARVGQTEIMCLMDCDIPEWSESQKTFRELNEIVDRVDAYILGLHCTVWM